MIAVKNTTATQFSENTDRMIFGKISKIAGTCVNPSPILKDNAEIVIFRCEKPHFPIICNPLMTIVPNIMIVQPPKTALGNVASNAPTTGKIPARIMITAPVAMTNRLTTFVIATSPTF